MMKPNSQHETIYATLGAGKEIVTESTLFNDFSQLRKLGAR